MAAVAALHCWPCSSFPVCCCRGRSSVGIADGGGGTELLLVFHNLDVPTPPDGIDDDDDDAAAVEEEEDMTVIDATDDGPSFFSMVVSDGRRMYVDIVRYDI